MEVPDFPADATGATAVPEGTLRVPSAEHQRSRDQEGFTDILQAQGLGWRGRKLMKSRQTAAAMQPHYYKQLMEAKGNAGSTQVSGGISATWQGLNHTHLSSSGNTAAHTFQHSDPALAVRQDYTSSFKTHCYVH